MTVLKVAINFYLKPFIDFVILAMNNYLRLTGFSTSIFSIILIVMPQACDQPFSSGSLIFPVYSGQDLGLTYTPERSTFKVWSPLSEAMVIRLYDKALGGRSIQEENMIQARDGLWSIELAGDLKGKFYTFQAKIGEEWMKEVPDPYVKAVGTNGIRGMVVDLLETNPENWENDQSPPLENFTDIIIYELHVRDLSMHPQSGIRNKGKYLGLTEQGTKNEQGRSTGLDHIKELGVTHIHLLPVYDYQSVDESRPNSNSFNWGYDPQNYNVPEGSYSTNPADGTVRIKEFKQMVQTIHENGLRVIMDVVYNHTYKTEESNFHQLVPGYYHRKDSLGKFSDASATGNETASERPMMRKLMIESLKYWVTEYHIDGFRFDLMGIHDIETMNLISEELHQIDPTIFIYGEGWTGGTSPLPDSVRALKVNVPKLNQIAAFSDDIRDGIKGHVFTHDAKGFISGLRGAEETIKFGIVAATQHPQINYTEVNYSDAPWAKEPYQTITYTSAHDNHTLWDRLMLSCPEESEAEKVKMQKLAGAIVLSSQGVPFLHAGSEMARTKYGDENSYKSSDTINQLDWDRKNQFIDVYEYYKGLIQLRKNHPAFRMPSTVMIQKHLEFLPITEGNLVAYLLKNHANGDIWKNILVILNGNSASKNVSVPDGGWTVALDGKVYQESGIHTITENTLAIDGRTALVLYQN